MKRINKKFFALLIIGLSAVATVTAASVSWFTGGTTIGFDNGQQVPIEAGAEPSYFAYGDGSSLHPYGIKDRVHLYNLAWLQYIGYFDGSSDLQTRQPYFVLDDDIPASGLDMSGITLPPIGSEKYPFLGHFNGNGKTIANLTVSNDNPIQSQSNPDVDFGVMKPSDQTLATGVPSNIVGFFGVVGATPTSTYPTASYDSTIVSLENFTLKNLVVKSQTSQTLIGLAAGYVDGAMSGVKISGSSKLDIGNNKSAITELSPKTTNLTDYSLVGYSTKVNSSPTNYSQKLSEYYNSDEASGQEDNNFGGSISSMEYMKWIYNHQNFLTHDSAGKEVSTMDYPLDKSNTINVANEYKLEFSVRSGNSVNGEYSYTSLYKNNNNYYDNYGNPLFFNSPSDAGATGSLFNTNSKTKAVVYHLKDGCYLPLKFSDENKTATSINNTGYIVGNGTTGSAVEGNPQLTARYYTAIGNSLDNGRNWTAGNSWNRTDIDSFANYQNKLEIMTYAFKNEKNTTNTGWRRISDTYNANNSSVSSQISSYTKTGYSALGLQQYEVSRSKLQTMFLGSNRIQSILFKNNQISSSNTISVNAKILGQSKSNYVLPKGSIVCNLKKTGFISFFAGTFYGGSSNITDFRFFSLYRIERNSDNSIKSLKRITNIYKNKEFNTDNTKPKYFYKYDDNSFSIKSGTTQFSLNDADTTVGDSGCIFNSANALDIQAPSVSTLYYFEVPVIDGEYALGLSTASSGTGAALIYLDLAANAEEKDLFTAYSITTDISGYAFPIGVDFAVSNTGNNGGESMGVAIVSTNSSTSSIEFGVTSNQITIGGSQSIGHYSFQGSKYTSGASPGTNQFNVSGNALGALSGTQISTSTRILTIKKKAANSGNITVAVVTDTLTNGTITGSTYTIGGSTSTESAVAALLPNTITLTTLRNLTIAATLTRNQGNNEFVVTYDEENCSYTNKTIDVDIEKNGTTIGIAVTNNYTFKIGGTTYANNSIYS